MKGLTLAVCNRCGQLFVPPAYICSQCGNTDIGEFASSGEGKVLSQTTVRVPPLGFNDQAPYEIAVIKLKEGINLTARIEAPHKKELEIGNSASFVKRDARGAFWFRLDD